MYNKDFKLLSDRLGITEREETDKYAKDDGQYTVQNTNFPNYQIPPAITPTIPLTGEMQARPQQMLYREAGNTSSINIQYTTPDGTQYQMSVITPDKTKGKIVQTMLARLYGLMMTEGGQEMSKYGKYQI